MADGAGKRCSLPTEGADGLMQPNCQQLGMGRGDCGCLHTRGEEIMCGWQGGMHLDRLREECQRKVG